MGYVNYWGHPFLALGIVAVVAFFVLTVILFGMWYSRMKTIKTQKVQKSSQFEPLNPKDSLTTDGTKV